MTGPRSDGSLSPRIRDIHDPYLHPVSANEIAWMRLQIMHSMDGADPEIRAQWRAAVARTSRQPPKPAGHRLAEALEPTTTMMANWVADLRRRYALLEGWRRGDLTVHLAPDATTPRFRLTDQGAVGALDLQDYLAQHAVTPQRNGSDRAFPPLDAETDPLPSASSPASRLGRATRGIRRIPGARDDTRRRSD